MILTKSHISLHDPAGPTPWQAPVLRFFRRFNPLFPRNPPFPDLRSGPGLYTQIRDRVSRAPGGVKNVRCRRLKGVRDRTHRAHLRKLQKKLDYVFFENKMRPCDGQL